MNFDVVYLTETRVSDGKCYDHLFPEFTPTVNYERKEALQSMLKFIWNEENYLITHVILII